MQNADDDKKKYSWSYKNGKMNCCTSTTSTCNVSKLWGLAGVTEFHDVRLQRATKEINAILDGLRKRNRDPDRDLNFVQIRGRHLLAWIAKGVVGPDDEEVAVRKALRLKDETSRRNPSKRTAATQQRRPGGTR
jgi:hypothetical protein